MARSRYVKTKLIGLKQIEKKLGLIGYAFGRDGGGMARTCQEIAEMMANDARSRTTHPHIQDAIVAKLFKGSRSGQPAAFVAIDYRKAPDAHLIEFGTDQRYTKAGASRGQMDAEPFFVPAVEANIEKGNEMLAAEAQKKIHGAARKR